MKHLIQFDGISPNDVFVIYTGKPIAAVLETNMRPKLDEIDERLSFQTSRSFERQPNKPVVCLLNPAFPLHAPNGYC